MEPLLLGLDDERHVLAFLYQVRVCIAQGLNDPRVPISEAEQILSAVKSRGTPVWYLLARDEGHGFRKRSNRDFFTQSTAMFIEQFLLDKKPE